MTTHIYDPLRSARLRQHEAEVAYENCSCRHLQCEHYVQLEMAVHAVGKCLLDLRLHRKSEPRAFALTRRMLETLRSKS